jgi:hypothetical protein
VRGAKLAHTLFSQVLGIREERHPRVGCGTPETVVDYDNQGVRRFVTELLNMPSSYYLLHGKAAFQLCQSHCTEVSSSIRNPSLLLFATVLGMSLQDKDKDQSVPLSLLIVIAGVLGMVVVVHTRFLFKVRSRQRMVVSDLEATTNDMQQTKKQLAANRALARYASLEAEALRTTTLTLTSNWQLDPVLDTLLASLAEVVPYGTARVLLVEDGSRLFVARENFSGLDQNAPRPAEFPLTLELDDFPLLKRVLKDRNPVVLPDVTKDRDWKSLSASITATRSCLCVPLVAADRALGILCAEHSQPGAFTSGHLRLARSLAISLAAAIQNARLYEQAQIYGAELEKRLADLRQTQRALEQAEEQRLVSEDKLHSIFHSSPVAFSISTLEGGRFLDANRAFEQRYGYSRTELLDSTIFELNFWEDRADRAFMKAQLDRGHAYTVPNSMILTKTEIR